MPVKSIIPVLLIILFIGCKSEATVDHKYDNLTEEERDSLSTLYHDYSMAVYQPSEMHRKFKDTALMIKPDQVEYRQRLSYSYKKRGEHIKAMEVLNEAVNRDVENDRTLALQYRAWSLLYFYRDYEGTIKDVDLIIEMEPKNNYPTCHGEPCEGLKGQALYKLGRYKEAIGIFENVLKVEKDIGWNPMDNFQAKFYLARCHSELEEYDKAQEIFYSQIEVNPKFTEAYFQLGKIYSHLGETKNALKNLQKASDLLSEGYKMGEPYYEAFDEVFHYQIEEELQKLTEHSL